MDLQLGTLDGDTLRLTTGVAQGYVYTFPVQWSQDGHSLLVSVAPRMNDPYDPLYPQAVRKTLYPPIGLRYSRIWAYDGTGKLSLLPIPEGVDRALCLDEGIVYYMATDRTIGGFRLK